MAKTMESAKEAAVKVGEQVSDFFQGNPFATPVGRKIEQATDASTLATENWGLNMEICDFINSSEDMARDAIRAIKKRLHGSMSRNNAVVMYTLTVLETCVKNCYHHFHVHVCQKEFILDLVKLIGPKFDAPQIIQERVLSLIQAWADAFKNKPDLQGVVQVYEDLKGKGVEFPAADLDSLAPIITPKKTVHGQPENAPVTSPVTPIVPTSTYSNYEVVPVNDGMPLIATPEQLQKLRKDLDVVNSNIKVFREMLTEIVPGKETVDELQLLSELQATCKQMQRRVLDLIRTVGNEEVTSELLVINDDFNSLFEKYERFRSNRTGETSSSSQNLIDLGTSDQPLSQQLSNMKVTTAAAYAANSEEQAAVGLATAVQNKIPTDSEAKEMENWLGAQEPHEKRDPENDKL